MKNRNITIRQTFHNYITTQTELHHVVVTSESGGNSNYIGRKIYLISLNIFRSSNDRLLGFQQWDDANPTSKKKTYHHLVFNNFPIIVCVYRAIMYVFIR